MIAVNVEERDASNKNMYIVSALTRSGGCAKNSLETSKVAPPSPPHLLSTHNKGASREEWRFHSNVVDIRELSRI